MTVDTYTWPDEPCDFCNGIHEGGPLGWVNCPACQGPNCPHPSIAAQFVGDSTEMQLDTPWKCDACGALLGGAIA